MRWAAASTADSAARARSFCRQGPVFDLHQCFLSGGQPATWDNTNNDQNLSVSLKTSRNVNTIRQFQQTLLPRNQPVGLNNQILKELSQQDLKLLNSRTKDADKFLVSAATSSTTAPATATNSEYRPTLPAPGEPASRRLMVDQFAQGQRGKRASTNQQGRLGEAIGSRPGHSHHGTERHHAQQHGSAATGRASAHGETLAMRSEEATARQGIRHSLQAATGQSCTATMVGRARS